MKERFYQSAANNSLEKNIAEGKNTNLVVIPVGGGKSVVIAHQTNNLLEKDQEGRVLLLAHRGELSTQNAEKITAINPKIKIGFEAAETICNPENQVMVASVQTVGKKGLERIRRWTDPKNIKAIKIDEAHHIPGGKTYQTVIEEIQKENPNVIVTGFTATPDRADGEKIDPWLAHVAYEISMAELVSAKYLAPLKGIRVKTQTSMESFLKDKKKDYNEDQLGKIVNNAARNQMAVDIARVKHPDDIGLAFCVNKAHASQVGELFNLAGIPTAVVTEDTPKKEREDLKRRLRSGEIKIAVSVGCLTEGFDLPEVKVLYMLRPTKSPVVYIQMIGRASRLIFEPNPLDPEGEWIANWELKSFSTVYDFIDEKTEETGSYTLSKSQGLHPEFDPQGEDIFAIQEKIQAESQNQFLLAAALQNARSLDEINSLLEEDDLLKKIQSIRYAPNQDVDWIQAKEDEYWLQLSLGEIVKISENALGQFVINLPKIDLKTRRTKLQEYREKKEKENKEENSPPQPVICLEDQFQTEIASENDLNPNQEPDFIDPQEILLPNAKDIDDALSQATECISKLIPSDTPLIDNKASWKEKQKDIPITEGQKNLLLNQRLKISREELEAYSKPQASELISRIMLQKSILASQDILTLGKYKNAPLHLINLYDPDYLDWAVKNNVGEKDKLKEKIQRIQKENPVDWLKTYRPTIYKRDFQEIEASCQKDFEKDPDDLRKVVRFALNQDHTRPWDRILEANKKT